MIEVLLFWSGFIVLLVAFAAGAARFRKNPRLATVSAGLLALLCVTLLAEAATRLYHWRALAFPFSARMQLHSDPELGWRGIAVMGDAASPRPRILVVGDSFTTPTLVDAERMYYSVLGRLLQAEIFAYGSGGYGTLQELMVLERYLPQVRPDLVILQVHANDFINNSWELERASYFNNNLLTRPYLLDGAVAYRFPSHLDGFGFFLATHSRLVYEATVAAQRLGAALSQAGYLRSVEHEIWQHGLAFPPFARAVDTTEELIGRIKRRAAPTPVVVFNADWDDGSALYAAWRSVLQRQEMRVCDDVGSSVRTAELRGERVRAADGAHWNAAGHSIAAEALARCLARPPMTRSRDSPR